MPGTGKDPSPPGILPALYRRAVIDAFTKLDPRLMVKNPVMFVVEAGSAVTTLLWVQALAGYGEAPAGFIGAIAAWLWFTVLFANFAEALAEGRGKAQAESLRKMRQDTVAKRLGRGYTIVRGREPVPAHYTEVSSSLLRKGDLFYVKAGDTIPADGDVIEGIASVNESAITGESAPVIRESGGDRSAVTGGTVILSDWLIIQASANSGEGFLDHMISLVEGAKRQKTPNEVALNILLIGLTVIFLVVCGTLWAFSVYSVESAGTGVPVTITVLIALLVCLAPTTIGGLLSAIGIAGMDRLIRRNVITTSGRAIEAAGDVDVLLLDKTGTITLGNRQAVDLIPVDGTGIMELVETAQLASLADETPEGRSIVVLAKEKYGLRGRAVGATGAGSAMQFVPFTSQTRMSGVDSGDTRIRKGAADAMYAYIEAAGHHVSDE
ncbi:MAG: potassium-transporting ATPase subunit KdpB, partial [Methanoregula sp.]|nr:potassium-transporting ATPase subunit KdpB [Methanoregula sp.]